ncbi:MAG: hypothetical protein H7066_18115 [Cytophagaceae bacterium]|nr:hypothetical protein [Gemmatimonadaceae bacterium]
MNAVLGLLLVLGTVGCLIVGATVFQLRSSDAAGNALAEVYLVAFQGALWLLLALALLVAGTRPARTTAPWGTINVGTLVMFAIAVAGQVAAMAALSSRAHGPAFRLVVQLAVVLPALAVLVHAAWRGFGLPLSLGMATWGLAAVVAASALAPLPHFLASRAPTGSREDPSIAEAALVYPAIVIHRLEEVREAESQDALLAMPTGDIGGPDEPFVIDSRLQVFVLRGGHATGRGIRDDGLLPVAGRLIPWEPDGTPESVRTILLRVQAFDPDSAKDAGIRARLRAQETLQGMIDVLRGR